MRVLTWRDISDLDMHDVAEFLRLYPPFEALDEETLAAVAASAEIEFYASGTAIIDSADVTSEFVYVVRRGSVELVTGDRLMDLVGEGEMFGYLSVLHHGPLGFTA